MVAEADTMNRIYVPDPLLISYKKDTSSLKTIYPTFNGDINDRLPDIRTKTRQTNTITPLGMSFLSNQATITNTTMQLLHCTNYPISFSSSTILSFQMKNSQSHIPQFTITLVEFAWCSHNSYLNSLSGITNYLNYIIQHSVSIGDINCTRGGIRYDSLSLLTSHINNEPSSFHYIQEYDSYHNLLSIL